MLSKLLVKDGCSKLYALSKFKFILTFDTIDQMEMSLANHEELDNWFYEVKEWDIYEVCDTRRVWIEVFGVPPMVGLRRILKVLHLTGASWCAWRHILMILSHLNQ